MNQARDNSAVTKGNDLCQEQDILDEFCQADKGRNSGWLDEA